MKKAKKKVRKKEDPVKEAEDLLVRKIRLLATAKQRATLKRWMGAARWVYNHVVVHVQAGGAANQKTLRPLFVHNAAFVKENTWMLDVPYDIRDGALQDALAAFKNGKEKQKANPYFKFNLKFRSKKDPTESIYVCSRAFKKESIYPQFELGKLRYAEELPKVEHDCRLQRTSLGHLYICIPVPLPPRPPAVYIMPPLLMGETQAQQQQQQKLQQRVVALDPGVRTFVTGYDPTGALIDVAPGNMNRIARLCVHLDKLQGRCDKAGNAKKRLRLKRAAMRLRNRIRDLVNDVHKKTACFLAQSYDLILLPKFETSKMVLRAQRRIRSKTARMMLTWAHFRFRQTLLSRVKKTGTHVKIVDEAYTPKTCGKCGVHQKLGGSKVFRCPSCGHQVDRDANGARNILLRNADAVGFVVEGHLRMALSPGTSQAHV